MSKEFAVFLLWLAVVSFVLGQLTQSCLHAPVIEDAALQSAWNCFNVNTSQPIRCA